MAKPRMDLSAFVGKLLEEQDGDVLREGIRVLSQALMETEVAGLIGAERHERTGERTAYRNGSRTRTWDTRMGTIELAIPKVRPGTYFPSLLQPRRRAEHALLHVPAAVPIDGLSHPQRFAEAQPFHHRADALVPRHARGAEFGADVGDVARDANAEDDAACAHLIQRGDLMCQKHGIAQRRQQDRGAEPDALRATRNGREQRDDGPD